VFIPFYIDGRLVDTLNAWKVFLAAKTYKEAVHIFENSKRVGTAPDGLPEFSTAHNARAETLKEWARAHSASYTLLQEVTARKP
jgi:hypothetical protein